MRIEILTPQGQVANTIVASEDFAQQHYPGAWRAAQAQGSPQPAPTSCTPAQGLVALYLLHGVTTAEIEAGIANIPDPAQRYAAQVALSHATDWQRSSPAMQQLAATLKLDDAAVDALFSLAVTVQI